MEGSSYDNGDLSEELPPGFRFHPRDEELLLYLNLKIKNEPLPPNGIHQVDFYRSDPDTLAGMYKPMHNNEWYFFTNRQKKYKRGSRPDRVVSGGYWRASGADKPIKQENEKIGSKRSLVYYRGKPSDHTKTGWLMTEFMVKDAPSPVQTQENDNMLDNWVICRMTKREVVKKFDGKEEDAAKESHATESTEAMHDEPHNLHLEPNWFSRGAQVPNPHFPNPIGAHQPLDGPSSMGFLGHGNLTVENAMLSLDHAAESTEAMHEEPQTPSLEPDWFSGVAQIPNPHFPNPIGEHQPLDGPSSMGFLGHGNLTFENAMLSLDHATELTEVMHDEPHNLHMEPNWFSGGAQVPKPHFPNPIGEHQPLDGPSSVGFPGLGTPAVENVMLPLDHAVGVPQGFGSIILPDLTSLDYTHDFSDFMRFVDAFSVVSRAIGLP